MKYVRRIQRNGVSIIRRSDRSGPPWIPHKDKDLRRWMEAQGFKRIEDIPAEADYREKSSPCERCGAIGVDVHHWAPKEWFGPEEAERWPKADLCKTCHDVWHWAAERAAAKLTARKLRSKGLWRLAKKIEEALELEEEPEEDLVPK